MMVQAKCVQTAWDSTQARYYFPNMGPLPGGLYELDLTNPAHRKLIDLKTQMGEFIFQFDRAAANNPPLGLYFCPDCGARSESLSLAGNHTKQIHKKTGWTPPVEMTEPELEEEEVSQPKPRKGPTCKGCGQLFANPYVLVKHKPTCPGKVTEVSALEVSEEVTQAETV